MRLFISYSSDDRDWVFAFWRALNEQTNHEAWIDRKLSGGLDWWESICKQVKERECLIAVLSPKALDSRYCRTEIKYAFDLNRPILPVILKPCTLPSYLDTARVQAVKHQTGVDMNDVLVRVVSALGNIEMALQQGKYPPKEVTSPDQPPPNAAELQRKFDEANDAFKLGDYEKAREGFDEVARHDKTSLRELAAKRRDVAANAKNAAMIYTLIKNYVQREDLEAATNLWQDLIKITPNPVDPLNLRARIEAATGENPGGGGGGVTAERLEVSPSTLLPTPFGWCPVEAGYTQLDAGFGRQYIQAFDMAQFPVTNAQFNQFVKAEDGFIQRAWYDFSANATAYRDRLSKMRASGSSRDNHPRTNVTWYDAVAYCRWLSFKMEENIMLPTEEAWQRAAQGDYKWAYPWGDRFIADNCNYNSRETTSVDAFPGGASPFGVWDMIGNVYEWCLNSFDRQVISHKTDADNRVMRGGCWNTAFERDLRHTCRSGHNPEYYDKTWGFRVARILA